MFGHPPPVLVTTRQFPAPTTIGVISDTHIFAGGRRRLAEDVLDLFRRFAVGLIVHAGDVLTRSVLADLAKVAPLLAVIGNGDHELVDEVPMSVEFSVGEHTFAVLHGHGGASARSEARRRYAGRVDCVIYGHSHIPLIENEDGTILFNPGSATDRRWQEHFGVGLISVTSEGIFPELVLFDDPRHLRNIKPDSAAN